jgi:uncharacterized membrane protein YgdD (TMEM256/DUF423 family)
MSGKNWVALGALLAGLAVAAGAFGAHALEGRLDERQLRNFETAVRYQMFHSLALIAVGLFASRETGICLQVSGGLFLLGIGFFCGGLYGWVFTTLKPFALIIPVGGAAWIAGWVVLAISAWYSRP